MPMFLLILYLIVYLFAMVLSVASIAATYVLEGLGFSGIARGLGLSAPWLSWIPGAKIWYFGRIADKANELTNGKISHYAKWNIVTTVIFMASPCLLFVSYIPLIAAAVTESDVFLIITAVVMFLAMAMMLALMVVCYVVRYISFYHIFKLCYPDQAVLFLVLGIFVTILLPIFTFCCRNKVPSFEYAQETDEVCRAEE